MPALGLSRVWPRRRRRRQGRDRGGDPGNEGGATPTPLKPRLLQGRLPLSFDQERLWLFDQLLPTSVSHTGPSLLRLRGSLRPRALHWALRAVVARHSSLRTRFVVVEGHPAQVIDPPGPVTMELVDLRHLGPAQRERQLRRLAAGEAARPFDLAAGLSLRVRLIRLGERDHLVSVAIHHLVTDLWSLAVLTDELSTLYRAFAAGEPSPLDPPALQYVDYAVWERRRLSEERVRGLLAWWRRRLEGAAPLELPGDRPRPPTPNLRKLVLWRSLDRRLSGALRELSRREGVTLFVLLLAAFQALLARCCGQEDVVVVSPAAGRGQPKLERVTGFFVKSLVLRGDLRGDPGFRELLTRTRETVLAAYEHQDVPFARLVAELDPHRDLDPNPLRQVAFALHNTPVPTLDLDELEVAAVRPEGDGPEVNLAMSDLELQVYDDGGGLSASLVFDSGLFDSATAERLVARYETLLRRVAADPDTPLSGLDLLDEEERRRLAAADGGGDDAPRDAPAVRAAFEGQARRTPDAVALRAGGLHVSYAELDARAGRVARRLRALGVAPEVVVALYLESGPDLAVALLSTLKAGGAYLPLDPGRSGAELAAMPPAAAPPVLVTRAALLPRLAPRPARVLCLDDALGRAAGPSGPGGAQGGDAEGLACVLEAGERRYVQVGQRAWSGLLGSAGARLGLTGRDLVAVDGDPVAAATQAELLLPLLCGGTAVFPPGSRAGGGWTAAALAAEGVTVVRASPARWRALLDTGWRGGPGVRALCDGGPLGSGLAWRLLGTGAEVWQLCGSAEAGVWSLACRVHGQAELGRGCAPLGRPLGGARAVLLDRWERPAPTGVTGTLLLGGAVLARGYLGDPAGTAGRFVPDPAGGGRRVFRLGQSARRRADGSLEPAGHSGGQVELRGHRIDLGEVEAAVAAHPAVAAATAALRPDQAGFAAPRLVAYVVPAGPGGPSGGELREFLVDRLAPQMVPARFLAGEATTAEAVPLPERVVPPRTPTERAVAELWAALLGVEPGEVDRWDSFFRLGGSSLLASQSICRIRSTLGIDLPLSVFLESPTVGHIAATIDATSR